MMKQFRRSLCSQPALSEFTTSCPDSGSEGRLGQYYTSQAPIYERVRPLNLESFDQVLRNLISIGGLSKSSKIMEVGCGTGRYIHSITEKTGCDGWGIDVSHSMLCVGNDKPGNRVTFINADAARIPVISDLFDTVFVVNAIHQIKESQLFLKECYRTLGPKGTLLIVTPSILHLEEFLLYKACPFLMEIERSRMVPEEVFIQLARGCGFRLIKSFISREEESFLRLDEFLICIRGRFLSCLASLTDQELKEVVRISERFANRNRIDGVRPYMYAFIALEKE